MAHSMRVAELEVALGKAIEYLRSLPIHPETHRHALEAERVLKAQTPKTVFEGHRMIPAGVVTIAVRLTGDRIEIKTADVDSLGLEMIQRHGAGLYQSLKIGQTFDLRPEGEQPLYVFR